MNKGAIKNFAVNARKRLIDSVKDKAGSLGITKDECRKPIQKGEGYEVYKTEAGTENKIYGEEIIQRRNLVREIEEKGYDNVIEEVAYTWFNRIIAIRFMEVNNYLPTKVRVLSSDTEGKIEPDIINEAPDIDLDFSNEDVEYIISCKSNNKLDELFRFLFIKQCNSLGEVLPELFEKTKDYTEKLLNISYINEDDVIRMLVDNVPECDFDITTTDENGNVQGQVEIIGWLYQYYNTEPKGKVDRYVKKGKKVTKQDIPAKTQLFTPDWIVKYMVENSLGRLWIEHLKAIDNTANEKKIAESFGWEYYLPEAEQEDEVNIKLAEIRNNYKELTPQDISCIDPCMGSGHVLVYMFDVLMDIYKSEGFSERDAAIYIIENNLNGLDIDERAHQLSYFAVMMKGRSYNRRLFSSMKIEEKEVYIRTNLYSIEESNQLPHDLIEQIKNNFGQIFTKEDLEGIKYIQDVFYDAKEYGSILNLDNSSTINITNYSSIISKLNLLWKNIFNDLNLLQIEFLKQIYYLLKKLLNQAIIMSNMYDVVVTNPPYLGNGDMDSNLSNFVKKNYPNSRNDLFSVFAERCSKIAKKNAYYAMITQPSILFLTSFESLRSNIIDNKSIISLLHMGRGIFGIDFGSSAFIIRNTKTGSYFGHYFRLNERTFQFINSNDVERMYLLSKANKNYKFNFSNYTYNNVDKNIAENNENKEKTIYYKTNQINFSKLPGCVISYWASNQVIDLFNGDIIKKIAEPKVGLQTGKNDIFIRSWNEVSIIRCGLGIENREQSQKSGMVWFPYNKGGNFRKWYGNNEYVVNWYNDGEKICDFRDDRGKLKSRPQNMQYYFNEGLTWSFVSAGSFGVRYSPKGFIFDVGGSSVFPKKNDINYILGFLCTKLSLEFMKIQNPTMNFQVGNVGNLPIIFDNEKRTEIEILVKENISISKNDWDSFETSWNFKTHPFLKLLNREKEGNEYRLDLLFRKWKDKCEQNFNKLKCNEEKLNKLFIDIYGLQEELTPEIDDNEITIRKADIVREIKSLISYAVGCILGRYSIDVEGLVYAGGDFNDKWDLNNKKVHYIERDEQYNIINNNWNNTTFYPEYYNIIPITEDKFFPNDIVSRFVKFIQIAFGEETLEENLKFIADALGNKGNSSRDIIRNYFIKDFFEDHCKIYTPTNGGKRPIYWLFDSGKENGFKALIYMHRYDKDTVGRVRTEYLHKTQTAIENGIIRADHIIENSTNSKDKAAATKEKNKYIKQLAETRIYDEAIAHIANQRIEIDLDDGVKVNYEKFQGVEVAQEGKKTIKVDLLAKIK